MALMISQDCLIPAEPLLEHFNCPVCMTVMKEVWVTSCFHRFCEMCIKESINATHRCPLCNHELQQANVQHDAQFNAVLESLEKSIKDVDTKKAEKFADEVAERIGDKSIRVQLEELFRSSLVSSLANHLTSENDMQSRYKKKRAQIQLNYDREMTQLQQMELSPAEYKKKSEEKTEIFRKALQELDNEIRNVQKLFIEAYKNHLVAQVSNFSSVPVQVRITFWRNNKLWKNKERQYPMRILHPEEKIENILPVLHELAEVQNDKIVDFGQMILFTLIDTFEEKSEDSILKRLDRLEMDDGDDDEQSTGLITVSRNARPVLEQNILRGTLIVVHGQILLDSEVPKKCFIQTFKESPGVGHLVDYFSCSTCLKDGKELRWICRSCASSCHKNHSVSPLIFGNKASGPKCDCRKFSCQINLR